MMKKSIVEIAKPALAGVIREADQMSAIAELKNCKYDGADMADLHLSCLKDRSEETLRAIIGSTSLPILALNYNRTLDWQDCQFTEEERVESLLCAVRAGAAGIDIQGYTYHAPSQSGFYGENIYSFTKESPKEVVTDPIIIQKQCRLIEKVHEMGAEILLSCHPGIFMNCEQVVELALYLEKRNPDIIKIVTVASNEEQLAESFKTMITLKREVKTAVSYHAGGLAGSLSRIVNPILGGHMIFCVDRYKVGSTMEQLDLKTVRTIVDHMKKI